MESLKKEVLKIDKSLRGVSQTFDSTKEMIRYNVISDKYRNLVVILNELDIDMYDKLKNTLEETKEEVNYFITKYSK